MTVASRVGEGFEEGRGCVRKVRVPDPVDEAGAGGKGAIVGGNDVAVVRGRS